MHGPAKIALCALIGGGLGLVTAARAIDTGVAGISTTYGQWLTWPSAGRQDEDPYTRAHFLLDGRLPISTFEATEFETAVDAAGKPLEASCTYVLEGPLPPSRWWSLWTEPGPEGSAGITSQAAVLEPDGTIRVMLSPSPQPGNWVKTAGGGYRVYLRAYSAGVLARKPGAEPPLPQVRLERC